MARRGRPTEAIVLSDDERETLERWARRPKSANALATRCRIVLACADGTTNREVAGRLGVHQRVWNGRLVPHLAWVAHDEVDRATYGRSRPC
jgi:hypothetical protein